MEESNRRFKELMQAYRVLRNDKKRKKYDELAMKAASSDISSWYSFVEYKKISSLFICSTVFESIVSLIVFDSLIITTTLH